MSSLEWRFQALVAAGNSIPALLVALIAAYASLVGGAVTGGLLWFVGGAIVLLILSYAGFCLVIASGLANRRRWACFAALGVYLLYVLLYALAWSKKPANIGPTSADLQSFPAWAAAISVVVWTAMHLVPWLDAIALVHLALRWRGSSAESLQQVWRPRR